MSSTARKPADTGSGEMMKDLSDDASAATTSGSLSRSQLAGRTVIQPYHDSTRQPVQQPVEGFDFKISVDAKRKKQRRYVRVKRHQ